MARRKRILLAASGGGHFAELLRIAPAFADHEIAFASVDLAYAQPGALFFLVPDVTRWEPSSIPNAWKSARQAIQNFRPEYVISTGALPGLLVLCAARTSAKTLHLESFANAESISGSGKLAHHFAAQILTQWPDLARDRIQYAGRVFSVTQTSDANSHTRFVVPRIFVTVGAQMPFDRLVRAVAAFAEKKPTWRFIFQVGRGGHRPRLPNADIHELLGPSDFTTQMQHATCIVSHAGTGNILAALAQQTPIVLLPRLASLRETRNEHQSATLRAFRDFAHTTENEAQLARTLENADTLQSRATLGAPDAELFSYLRRFVHGT